MSQFFTITKKIILRNASPKKTPISSSKNEEENGDISNAIDDAYDVATQVIVVPK